MPRGGGRGGKKAGKPRRPAHQNSFAFKHNKHSKKTKFIAGLPTTREQGSGLCKKCSAIIEWRKFYRKYKPLREAHKCASCGDRKVTLAYHVICSDCAYDANICPKCRTKPEVVDTGKEEGELDEDQVLEVLSSASLKQRQRRTIMRKFENGTLDIEELQKILGDTSVGDDEEDEDDDEPEEKPEDDGDDADAPAAEDEDVSPEGLERKALKEAERDADLDTSHPGDWTVFDEKYDEVKHEAIMAARFTARVEAQMKAYRAAAANERAAAAAKKDEKGGDDDDEEDGNDAEEGEEEDAEEGEEDADEEEEEADDDGEGEGDEDDDEAAEEGEDEGEDEEDDDDDSGRGGAAAAAVPAAKGKKQLEPIAGVRFKASIANKLNAGEDHLRKINAQSKHDKDKGRMQHGASHTHAAMKAKAAANTKK